MGDSPGTGSQDRLSRTGSKVSFEFKGDTQEWERIFPDLSPLCSDVDTVCSATAVFLASLTVCSSVPLGKLHTSDKKEPCSLFWWRQTSVWQLGSTGFASILPIPKRYFFLNFFKLSIPLVACRLKVFHSLNERTDLSRVIWSLKCWNHAGIKGV